MLTNQNPNSSDLEMDVSTPSHSARPYRRSDFVSSRKNNQFQALEIVEKQNCHPLPV